MIKELNKDLILCLIKDLIINLIKDLIIALMNDLIKDLIKDSINPFITSLLLCMFPLPYSKQSKWLHTYNQNRHQNIKQNKHQNTQRGHNNLFCLG